ncbi:MAG TPA: tetratricopeptide repeat protein [Thermomicrobiales bacterium]|nr:tetratricopeptide repeat protein [Thermomicrobiales bacterium]
MAKLPDISDAIRFDENLREVPRWPDRIAYALRRARKQLAEAREAGYDTQILRTLGYLTDASRVAGDLDAAVTYGQEALERARASGNSNAIVANLIRLGEAHTYRDEPAVAEPLLREALALSSQGDSGPLQDYALQHLGKLLLETGSYDESITYLEQALALRQAKGNQPLIESTQQALDLVRARRETRDA